MLHFFFGPGLLFFFFSLFHLIQCILEICFPLFLFSRNHVYWLGSLVLLIEFSHVAWKFSFPFSNNIKEQQVSKKKAWSLPLYRFNINLNRPGQVKAGQQIFYLYKGRSGCQQTQRDETLRNRGWWSGFLVVYEIGVTTIFV